MLRFYLRDSLLQIAGYTARLVILLLLFTAAARAQCIPGGLAVVVNKSNPVENLSMSQLRRLVLGDVRVWQDNKPISLVARDLNSKAFQCMVSAITGLSVGEYVRHCVSGEFRGDEPMVIETTGSDVASSKFVSVFPGAIAIIEANSLPTLSPSVKIIRIDGKTPGQKGYPL